jgi:D-alanyl-D-alanine carboxypeptidase
VVRPKPIAKVRIWVTSVALGTALLGLGAATFAQFQVNQRAGWITTEWTLTSTELPLKSQIQQGLVTETRYNSNVPGQIMHVSAPSLGLDDTFVAGDGVLPDDDVRVASNIKPFVAASALKLVEDGRLTLDAPIAPYLSGPVRAILERADRKINAITLRHLLTHSSGIADYGSSKLFQILAYVPTAFGLARFWTPQEQIWFAANLTPKREVGGEFDYSDTNYLIASDMIANATKTANAGVALRRLLDWPELGAPTTFWEFYEPTPASTHRVRQFRGAIEDTNIDVSFDQYGGGGLVMSMADLAHAHRAIVRGDVFAKPAATSALMQTAGSAAGANGYGMGVTPIIIEGETCWSHGGRWGTIALYCPRMDLSISRSWGQSNAHPDPQDPKGVVAGLVRLVRQKLSIANN